MNKYIILPFAAALALAVACTKEQENPYAGEELPTVSMTASASSFAADEADLVFTLSHFIHKDVVVTFNTEGIDAEAVKLPSSFTIPAGKVKETLTVGIDETVPNPGNYNVSIAMATAENATIASQSSVSLSETVQDLARLNVSGSDFVDGAATIRVNLHKKLATPATLTLELVAEDGARYPLIPASAAQFNGRVTIPVGERMATIPVTVDMDKLPYGLNQLKVVATDLSSNLVAETAGTTLNCRVPIVLNQRNDWSWGYDLNTYKRYYVYNNGMSGTAKITVLSFAKPGTGLTDEFLEEQIYQHVTNMTNEYYSTTGWSASYLWLAPQEFEPGDYYAVLVGLDANLSPTGDYALEEIHVAGADEPVEVFTATKTDWAFQYYSGWYYVRATGVKFGIWTIPGDYDMTDSNVVIQILKAYEAELKANTSGALEWRGGGTTTASYPVFELSAAAYTTAPYYSWNGENSSTDSYHGVMIGLDAKGNATGEYNYITFDW